MKFLKTLIIIWFTVCLFSPAYADKSWTKGSVASIQTSLNELGFAAGPEDGLWGAKTEAALELFCQEYGKTCGDDEEATVRQVSEELDDSYLDVILDHSSAVWLENRIGYGAPKQRVDRYVGMTRRAAIELIVEELRTYEDNYVLPSWFQSTKPLGTIVEASDSATCDLNYMKSSLQSSWLEALYTSEVPQFDRLSTFWLDHFSVAYDSYVHPHAFAQHTEIVRNWRGSFLDLLYASLSDPAIIVYLNNDKSDRNTPNENLAREFFELFSIGEGNYSETDVREFARLLTGRAFNTAEESYEYMRERAIQPTVKLFGEAHSSVESLVYSLDNHNGYGDFIIKKLYQEFVELEQPSPKDLRKIRTSFLRSDSDLVDIFESIISLKSFWDLAGQMTLIKNPLDLYAGTSRTLNFTGKYPYNYLYWSLVNKQISELEQSIFDPPSIDGWPTGRDWIQGQDIDRRAVALGNFFPEELTKDIFSPAIGRSSASRYWKDLSYNRQRDMAQREFFSTGETDQVLIGDIYAQAYKWAPNQFNQLMLTFHDIHYKDEVFDQITISLSDTSKAGDPWRRHLQIWKELSSNDFLSGLIMESNGSNVWYATRLPISNSDGQTAAMSSTQRNILKHLVHASSALLSEPRLRISIDDSWESWLTKLLLDSGGIVDTSKEESRVRIFQPPDHPDSRFSSIPISHRCDHNMGREEVFIDSFFQYEKIRNISGNELVISTAIDNGDFNDPVLRTFAENLGKIWFDAEVLPMAERSAYLLPQLHMQDWRSAITSVEYNLR